MKHNSEPTRRESRHTSTRDEIMEVARKQIAEQGAAALSLREIARQMRMTAPALYRYFKDRDDLVTALIVTAFRSFADTLKAARDSQSADDHANQLFAIALAYRSWARAHPQDYMLIFGTPIPGYKAPAEITQPEAKCSMDVLIDALEATDTAGELDPASTYAKPSPALLAQLNHWRKEFGYSASTIVLYLAVVGWSRLHGLVSLEIENQFEPFLGDIDELYRNQALELMKQFGVDTTAVTRKKKS
ncbi:MAG: TetR/AcrR family transcriptional regulator [Chloroflexi bacterium]|nr:TetR/AcrR family transcriptional regulator [Chloroflexota bacterium]